MRNRRGLPSVNHNMLKKGVALLLLLGLVALFAIRLREARRQQGELRRPAGEQVPLVEVDRAKRVPVREQLSLIGALKPEAQVEVSFKISGKLGAVYYDVGDRVRRGALLARLEDEEQRQGVRQAEAALEVAQAQLKQRQAEVENLERQFSRARELHEHNLIPRQELDDIETRLRSARAQLELAMAQVAQSEAGLAQWRIQLEHTRLLAPMAGLVARRYLDPGAMVNPQSPIFSLVDLSKMKILVNVVEGHLSRIKPGLPAQITVDAYPQRSFAGKVARISPVLDPATRTAEVEIELPNTELLLRGEMTARVELALSGERQALVLPREALVQRGHQKGVYILESETVRFHPVETGVVQGGNIEVVGIGEQENVVVRGANLLRDGSRVRVAPRGTERRTSNGREKP